MPLRQVSAGILHLAYEGMVDAIVMSTESDRPGSTVGIGRTSQEILRRSPCEVILDKCPAGL